MDEEQIDFFIDILDAQILLCSTDRQYSAEIDGLPLAVR